MTNGLVAKLLEREREKRMKMSNISDLATRLRAITHDAQHEFITAPGKRIVATCSRQCGKSTGCGIDLVFTAILNPKTDNAYITLTRVSAKKIIWRDLKNIIKENKLGKFVAKIDATELSIEFKNGSMIYLYGAKDENDIGKILGMKFKLVYLDECQEMKNRLLSELLTRILPPTLWKHNGVIKLIGTPNAMCEGIFYDAFTGKIPGWKSFHWNAYQNKFLDDSQDLAKVKKKLDDEIFELKLNQEDPVFKREYLGLWVRSFENSIYKYNPAVNSYLELDPEKEWFYVLGMDFGFSDDCAWVVLAFNPDEPYVYIVETLNRAGILPTEAALITKGFMKRYEFQKIIGDTGGLGKPYAEEMRQRHGIPVEPAEKSKRLSAIKMMNDDFRMGRVKIKDGEDLAEEWMKLQWEKVGVKERDGQDNHLSDAALYGWRECKHWIPEAIKEFEKEIEDANPKLSKEEEYIKRTEEEYEQRIKEANDDNNPYSY